MRRLRGALSTAQATIEALEEPPVPPAVLDVVVPQHVVADFARMGRWLVHEDLGRATMGGMAMPRRSGAVVSTRMLTMMPRIDERRWSPDALAWVHPRRPRRLAPAGGAVGFGEHGHRRPCSRHSCTRPLHHGHVVREGPDRPPTHRRHRQEHIGRIIIVEPDAVDEDAFLRQAVEALQQGACGAWSFAVMGRMRSEPI